MPNPDPLEAILDLLTTDQMNYVGASLIERARHRREPISAQEALEAFEHPSLTTGWETSTFANVGRVRIATAILVGRGWLPEQVAKSMCALAAEVSPHPLVAIAAVAAGIADGQKRS